MKEKIVGNASGLRRLTVFLPSSSAFSSHSKHSGVKCSEQTRLCLDTGGSFKRNLTSYYFKKSGFLSCRVKKLAPRLMSMSSLQQPKAIQCTISCTCAEVTLPLYCTRNNEFMTSSFTMAAHKTVTTLTVQASTGNQKRVSAVNH